MQTQFALTSKTPLLSISRKRSRILLSAFFCATVLAAYVSSASAKNIVDTKKVYQMLFSASLDPKSGQAHASVTLRQHRQLVRSIEFAMPKDRYLNIQSTSPIETDGDRIIWRPLKKGDTLHFDFVIDHQRSNQKMDARITDTWALLKLDYLFPTSTTRVVKGATSETRLILNAPKPWLIETSYGSGAGQVFVIDNPRRNFDAPRGWVIAGELGVRRENKDGRHISVAAPLGSGLQANDVLAFLRWTLPSLVEVLPDTPQRLLIVSGSEDMWRGGLSGVGSLYLHSDRPLISGNRTSPLLHELFHVASGLHSKAGADWIIEGLAEYYSLTLLLRSDGISRLRYNKSFETLARWSANTRCTATDRSKGKQTAHGALVMRALDAEIRSQTGEKASLDTLVRKLVQANEGLTNASFRASVTEITGMPVRALTNCP
ncbi:MAG: hypothetical protein P8J79_07695 [Halioglobus sp.]|nr:hypothetical protein [Halioglobus sp.]